MRDAWHACVLERQWGRMRASVDRMMPHLRNVHSLYPWFEPRMIWTGIATLAPLALLYLWRTELGQ